VITVKAVLDLALEQDGYLEKASPAGEDSLTDNAGSNNYTKYGRDLVKQVGSPYADGVPWCDEFCDWLFLKLGGKQAIMENLYGFSAYTPTSAQYFKNNNAWYTGNAPKPGYQIFFKNAQRICHTGIVIKCEGATVYTIEGNTSSDKGVVANGGCVRQKSYPVTYPSIAGYGIPKCAAGQTQTNQSAATQAKKAQAAEVKKVQVLLNQKYMPQFIKAGIFTSKLAVDGDYGKMTRHAILAVWKTLMNQTYSCGFDPKNSLFGPSCNKNSEKCVLRRGSRGDFVICMQMVLKARGYYTDNLDGIFGPNTCRAVVQFEKDHNLIVESVGSAACGKQVWFALFN